MISVTYTGAIVILSLVILVAIFLFWKFVWGKLNEISDNQKVLANNQAVLNSKVDEAIRQADAS